MESNEELSFVDTAIRLICSFFFNVFIWVIKHLGTDLYVL